MIEVAFFEPLEKDPTISINMHEIPRVNDIVKILNFKMGRIDYEFKVDRIIHLCTENGHLVAAHCMRLA